MEIILVCVAFHLHVFFFLQTVHTTSQSGIFSPATTGYSAQACRTGICLNRYHSPDSRAFSTFASHIPQNAKPTISNIVWNITTNLICLIFFSSHQIVIHAMQCTHYIILWHLAKVSDSSSLKVFTYEAFWILHKKWKDGRQEII